MDRPGDHALACSGFSRNQDADIGAGDLLQEMGELLHHIGVADQVLELVAGLNLLTQVEVLLLEALHQVGVIDGYGRQLGKGNQEVEIFGGEAVGAPAINVDGPENLVADAEGDAHQGLDLKRDDALALPEALVRARIDGQHRRPAYGYVLDYALADFRGVGYRFPLHSADRPDCQ